MKKLVFLLALSCTLVGCSDTYRYPCQDPANKNKAECNRPDCEDDGMCYDTLNGLPPKQVNPVVEEVAAATTPVVAEEHVVVENTGE
jgi:hypothetical protein